MHVRTAFLILALCALCTAAPAATFIVDPAGSGDAVTIQAGIDLSASGDTVLVTPGVYEGQGNTSLDFGGRRIALESTGGCGATVIDCGDSTRAFHFHSAEALGTLVRGFTVRNGSAEKGGAVRVRSNARPTFRECAFRGNRATEDGGAVHVGTGSAFVGEDLEFKDNLSASGGAVFVREGHLVLERCSFVANTAGGGGAVRLYYGYSASLTDCAFSVNEAGAYGGAVMDQASDPHIDACTFSGNTTECDDYYAFGGAVYSNVSNSAVIADCHFEENTADGVSGFGGALTIDESCVTVSRCTFEKNTAAGHQTGTGGALYICGFGDGAASPAHVEDCLFRQNMADGGGGFGVHDTSARFERCSVLSNEAALVGGGASFNGYEGHVVDCLFAHNTASTYGGGIMFYDGSPLVTGMTVVDNTAPRGGGIHVSSGGAPTLQRVLIAFNDCGVGCSGEVSQPLFLCSDIFGNTGGDWIGCVASQLGQNGNICADPQFCAPGGDVYDINEFSPCAPGQSGCGLIGAVGVGCSWSSAEATSWGELKALFR
jgi:hypothetical protein